MTMYKINELTGYLLNRAVAKAFNFRYEKESCVINDDLELIDDETEMIIGEFYPAQSWEYCGELIEKFSISIETDDGIWCAAIWDDNDGRWFGTNEDKNLKTAICRCVVASVFGDEVEL